MSTPPEHQKQLICILAAICQSGSNHSTKSSVDLAEGIIAEVDKRHPDWSEEPTSTIDPDPPVTTP